MSRINPVGQKFDEGRLAQVLVEPIVSEKATSVAEKHNQVLFKVLRNASKPEIKAAVEKIYKVRVVGINTSLRQSKTRMLKFGKVDGTFSKKAIVRLHKDDSIELFG